MRTTLPALPEMKLERLFLGRNHVKLVFRGPSGPTCKVILAADGRVILRHRRIRYLCLSWPRNFHLTGENFMSTVLQTALANICAGQHGVLCWDWLNPPAELPSDLSIVNREETVHHQAVYRRYDLSNNQGFQAKLEELDDGFTITIGKQTWFSRRLPHPLNHLLYLGA